MTHSTVNASVSLSNGGNVDYTIELVRDGIGWKVASVTTSYVSQNNQNSGTASGTNSSNSGTNAGTNGSSSSNSGTNAGTSGSSGSSSSNSSNSSSSSPKSGN